jgi:hypothetical protein
MSVSEWIPNLARRLEQLDMIARLDSLANVEIWLGGLFFPEAYITATRQAVAHRKKWSLETLHMRLDIERVNDPGAFIVDGASPPSSIAMKLLIVFKIRLGTRGCGVGRGATRAEPGRVCALEPIADPLGAGRGGRGGGQRKGRQPARVSQQ